MDDNEPLIIFSGVMLVIVCSLLCAVVADSVGYDRAIADMRKAAIEKGAGEFDSKTGVWRWIDTPSDPPSGGE